MHHKVYLMAKNLEFTKTKNMGLTLTALRSHNKQVWKHNKNYTGDYNRAEIRYFNECGYNYQEAVSLHLSCNYN